MKRIVLISLLLITFGAYSQDVITLTDGTEIKAKVNKISDKEIEYKKWNNIDGPVYRLDVNKITSIKYINGENDIFSTKSDTVNASKINYELLTYTKYNKVSTTKPLTDDEVENLLKENYPEAYNLYMAGCKKTSIGSTLGIVGITSLAASLVIYYLAANNSYYINLTSAAIVLDVIGTGLFIASIPVNCVGKGQITESYDMYNDFVRSKNKDVSLNFGVCPSGGIGMSLRF
jgi:hypothetical protein